MKSSMGRDFIVFAMILLLAATTRILSAGQSNGGAAVDPVIAGLPATFVGTIPCADCPGIRYQVNLLPDRTYVSRLTYLERNTEFVDHGNWHISKDGKILILEGQRGAREQFSLRVADTLRKLDADGHQINSPFNYDLKRSPTFAPIESRTEQGTAAMLENTDWKETLPEPEEVTAGDRAIRPPEVGSPAVAKPVGTESIPASRPGRGLPMHSKE